MKNFLILALALLFSLQLFAGRLVVSEDILQVREEVKALTAQYANQDILVVFDIDDTLLRMPQDLGSVAWVDWQESLMPLDYAPNRATGESESGKNQFRSLYYIAGLIGSLSKWIPVQPETPTIVKEIQDQGIPTIALTSRSFNNYELSIRGLTDNNIHFENLAPGPEGGYGAAFLPYDLKDLEKSGLSEQEMIRIGNARDQKVKAPRRVAYREGIFLSTGMHKGAMLRILSYKIKRDFRAILFVDDKLKNVNDVLRAYDETSVDIVAIHYTRRKKEVEEFLASDKSAAIQSWNNFLAMNRQIFGESALKTPEFFAD